MFMIILGVAWHFRQSFGRHISRMFTDHSQMSGFRHITALKVRNVRRVEFSCPFIVWCGQLAGEGA